MGSGGSRAPLFNAHLGPPDDPVAARGIVILGVYFFSLAALTFYLLVATWPVPDPALHSEQFANFSVFGWQPNSPPSADLRLFVTVAISGALGSLIHCITSFADYVGNRRLGRSWVWWLILRTPTGIALALLFYLVLRGGLVAPSLPTNDATIHASAILNPYGLAAIAAMAGMFSKQATDKLREIFDTLFRTNQPVERADPLGWTQPVISSAQPASLTVGAAAALTVTGYNFHRDCTASVNGKPRDLKWESENRLTIALLSEDVAAKGELRLAIHNPGPLGGESPRFVVPVMAAA